MKILIIHQHFRTREEGGALGSYYLATGLQRLNNQVSVLTAGSPNLLIKPIDGVSVRYLKVKYDNTFGFLRRLMAYSLFTLKAIINLRNYKDCDVVYIMSTPLTVGIIGLFGKFLHKIPFAFESGDLWPDVPIQMGIIRNSLFKWFVLKLERVIYNNAVLLVALSTDMKILINSKTKTTVIVIENFSDSEYFNSAFTNVSKASWIPEGAFTIAYIGTLGIANKVEKLVNLSIHLSNDNVHVVIQGRGKELSRCRKIATDLELANVHFLPFGDKNSIRDLLSFSDAIFVCFDSRFPLLATGCPNKLMDGLAAGKIIFINYKGWQKELIENNNCGAFIDTDVPEIGSKVVKSIITERMKIQKMKDNSRRLAQSFEIEVMTLKLNQQLEQSITKARAYTRKR